MWCRSVSVPNCLVAEVSGSRAKNGDRVIIIIIISVWGYCNLSCLLVVRRCVCGFVHLLMCWGRICWKWLEIESRFQWTTIRNDRRRIDWSRDRRRHVTRCGGWRLAQWQMLWLWLLFLVMNATDAGQWEEISTNVNVNEWSLVDYGLEWMLSFSLKTCEFSFKFFILLLVRLREQSYFIAAEHKGCHLVSPRRNFPSTQVQFITVHYIFSFMVSSQISINVL